VRDPIQRKAGKENSLKKRVGRRLTSTEECNPGCLQGGFRKGRIARLRKSGTNPLGKGSLKIRICRWNTWGGKGGTEGIRLQKKDKRRALKYRDICRKVLPKRGEIENGGLRGLSDSSGADS